MSVAFRVVRTKASPWARRFSVLACLAVMTTAAAQNDAPVAMPADADLQLLVAAPVGSIEDQLARTIGHHLAPLLHQEVSVVTQSATGLAPIVADAAVPADGRHVVLGWTSQLAMPPSSGRRGGRPVLDVLEVVAPVASIPYVLVVNPALPVAGVAEFTEHVRRRPGELHFASAGNGSLTHLAGQLYMSHTGTNMVHVPYSAAGHATNNLMTGDIQAMFHLLPSVLAPLRQGRLRALAVLAAQRSDALPEVPTMAEQGYEGLEVASWFVLLAPRGTPPNATARWRDAVARLADDAGFQQSLARLGVSPVSGGAHDAYRLLRDETTRWHRVAAEASMPALMFE